MLKSDATSLKATLGRAIKKEHTKEEHRTQKKNTQNTKDSTHIPLRTPFC